MKIKLNDIHESSKYLPMKRHGSLMGPWNSCVDQVNACDVWLDEEELARSIHAIKEILRPKFIVKHVETWENVSEADKEAYRGLAKAICANSQKIIRMGKS